jgi:hypothetical protein
MTRDFLETGPLKRLPHPPHSLDISPSDFDLFGKVKGSLLGQEIPDEVGLLDTVIEILNGISHDELPAMFRNWIECVQEVINTNAGYGS